MNKKQLLFKTLSMAVFAAVMLFNTSEVSAQVKIGSNPTVINAANNLEVESADPTKKVSVDKTTGKVTIADGSQGVAKILTSDATGVATWKQAKITSIYSFHQTTGTVIALPFANSGVCATLNCAVDLGRNGVFTITNNVSDVVIDITGGFSVYGNTTAVEFNLYVAIDKTTPGVFELLDLHLLSHPGTFCTGGSVNLKSVLQNLPPRTYNVKVYASQYTNFGAPASLGIGSPASPNPNLCGASDFDKQNLIISVSE